MEEGLAGVVTNERFASGHAIGIRDHWRCQSERCSNNPGVCWVRSPAGRQIERIADHYPLNGNMIANWASAITRQECTIEEPSQDLQLQFIMSKDRIARENKRRRKTSPASSSSSLDNLTRAILVGHLAQLKQPQQQCQHHSEPLQRRRWVDIEALRPELTQHTRNFFSYWKQSMPHAKDQILEIYDMCKCESYDINMLMDPIDGMTFQMWTFYDLPPSMLAHLRRKAHDWMKDYTGLSGADAARCQKQLAHQQQKSSSPIEEREPLGEVSGN